jgi:hypothetical protein
MVLDKREWSPLPPDFNSRSIHSRNLGTTPMGSTIRLHSGTSCKS